MRIPYYFFRKGDAEGLEKWMKNLEPDLIVVYSMSHLLTENIFSIPKLGTVNLHYSYLPEYRGPTPVFWEYYDYVLNPGVTVHYLDKGEDTGDIIYQTRIHIKSGEKFEEVSHNLSFTGAKLISKLMKDLEGGNISRIKQPISSPTLRARKIKPEEYSGLIKWDEWDVERVFHFLSGTLKYHSTLLNKNRFHRFLFQVKIIDREKCDTSGYKIGKLYKENSKQFFVCKDGKIYVGFRLSAANFFAWFYPYIS
jgi:methionyl-tRNA formyltransferase